MNPKARTPGLPTLERVPPGGLTIDGRYAADGVVGDAA